MLKYASVVFFLLVHIVSLGGDTKHLTGYLLINKKKIQFEIGYNIQSNNLITGTSMTAKGTSDETKCKVRGKYNKKNHSIYFYETVVIHSRATYENLNFCLLAARMKRTTTKGIYKYNGTVTGYVRGSKKKCATGSIYLEQKRPIPSTKPTAKERKTPPPTDTLFSDLHNKKMITYDLKKGHGVSLTIWDDANVDGDRISIYLNGKEILHNYELKRVKKVISITLPHAQSEHYLKILALNEGRATPNTSRIQISGANLTKNVRAHIKEKEAVYITLKN